MHEIEVLRAGIGLIIGLGSALLFAGGLAFAFLQQDTAQTSDMKPKGLDEFGFTQADEGTVAAMLYGYNRVPGNLLYYGNLTTKEIYEETESGKGGGAEKQISGYEYRVNVWQGIGCTSPGNSRIDLQYTYVDDVREDVEAADIIYNNGIDSTFPSFVPKGGIIPNLAHIGYEQIFLGANSTSLPVIHFVTYTYLATGLPYENMTDGNNPAAVIYDLALTSREVRPVDIDLASFQAAATYYNSIEQAFSGRFDSVQEIHSMIQSILDVFPGVSYVNSENKLVLKAFDPNEAARFVIGTLEHSNLRFKRVSYDQTINDFSGNYIDRYLDFSERNVGASNDAAIELAGKRIKADYDLKYMCTSTMAARRINDHCNNESYPKAILNFDTNLKYKNANPGDIIEFTNEDLGLFSMFVRVNEVSKPGLGENKVSFKATQMVERLFDAYFVDNSESDPSGIDNPVPSAEILDFFEFPYNPVTEFERIRFALVERVTGIETSFNVGYSPTRTPTPPATELEFKRIANLKSFSMSAKLEADFNFNNFLDNTTTGILLKPNITYYPEFSNEDLIASYSSNSRYILIGSEILTFATVTPEGAGVYRFTGLQRGVFGSRIRTNYPSGTDIIVFNVLDNIVSTSLNIGNLSKIQVAGLYQDKRQNPPLEEKNTENEMHSSMVGIPCYFEVIKTGLNLDFSVYPNVNANNGFGRSTPNTVIPRSTREMPPNGIIRVFFDRVTSSFTDFTTVDFSITAPHSGAIEINMQVIENRDGKENRSQYVTFDIDGADGTYIFNSYSVWSRKVYDVDGNWVPTYIGDRENE